MARRRGTQPGSGEQLLGAAWELMSEQGVRGMSVDAVVARAGLSKGTFFHFFPTKHDFLEALCRRLGDISWEETVAPFEQADAGTDPIARANLLFAGIRQWRAARSPALGAMWRELAREENASLSSMVLARWSGRLGTVLTGLIESGNARGVMRVADPEVVGPLVAEWVAASTVGSLRLVQERSDREVLDLVVRRSDATVASIERVLGLAEHSLARADPGVVLSLAAAMQQDDQPPAREDRAVPAASPSRRNP